jgi:ribosomal protein S27E
MSKGNYFPRTLRGWKALFWLAVGRCPQCHGRLLCDPWDFAQTTVYCMPCGGAMYPAGGVLAVLRANKAATAKENASGAGAAQPERKA